MNEYFETRLRRVETLFIMHIDNGKHRRDLLLNIDFCSFFFLTRTKYQAVKNLFIKVKVKKSSFEKP